MKKLFALFAFLGVVFALIGCTPGQSDITIIFETNGGDPLDNLVVSANDTDFVLPTPVREGHDFDGWYIDESLNNPFSIINLVTNTGQLTLYAKWTPIETPVETVYVTVTFESNGGSAVTEQVIVENTTASEPADPTRTGHVFEGWYVNAELTTAYDFSNAVATDITLYAKWSVMMLTVRFFDDDETTILKTESVPYGTAATPPADPTKASTAQYDFSFNGWDQAFNNVTTDLDVYATYTETLRSYTVTFYDADGTTVLKTETVAYGADATPPANPTKAPIETEIFIFDGWDKAYDNITGELSVVATYRSETRIYTVTYIYEKDGVESTHVINDLYVYLDDNLDQYMPDPFVGYLFDGWYYDDVYTQPYDHTPLETDITLYGRYLALASDPLPIATIHETKPLEEFLVSGVVYAVLESPMGMMVFIQDITGQIMFPLGGNTLEVGDLISFSARFGMIPDTPIAILNPTTDIVVEASDQPLIPAHMLDLYDIKDLDPMHWSNFGKDIITHGYLETQLTEYGEMYFLFDYLTDSMVIIQPESVTQAVIDAVGQRVTMGGLLIPGDMGMVSIFFTEIQQPLIIDELTDQELLDELVLLATTYLDGMVFFSGQVVSSDMFMPPEIFGVTILFETFGDNATSFDFMTYTFAEVETEQIIDVRITISKGELEEIVEITFILKPIEISTVAEFLAGENEAFYFVEGVILSVAYHSDEPTIIADETGILVIMGTIFGNVGDRIIIYGMRYEQEGMVFMVGMPEVEIVEVIDIDQPNPLTPTPKTLAEITLMTPTEVMMFEYIEVQGMLYFHPEFMDFPILMDGDDHLMVFPLSESYDVLKSLEGVTVTLRGFLFGSYEDEGSFNPFMLFVNFPGDLVIPTLTDQEIIDLITDYLSALNLGELREFDYLFLPDRHPLFDDIIINWTPTGESLIYFDMMEGQILELMGETTLGFTVSFTVNDLPVELDFEYVAYPEDEVIIHQKTIAEIHNDYFFDNIRTQGTIYYIVPNEGFFMFDVTGQIYVNHWMTDGLSIGDLVEFVGYQNSFGMVKYVSVYDSLVTLDVDQPIPLPDTFTFGEVAYFPYDDPDYYGIDVILTGFLVDIDGMIYLYDPFDDRNVWIYTLSYDVADFTPLIGQHVRLGAVIVGDYDGPYHIYYNPYHQPLEAFNTSPEDLVDMLLLAAQEFLDGMIFLSGQTLDGSFLTPPDIFGATILFETFGTNAALLDFVTLQFEEVTEEAIIDVRITVTIADITKSVDIQIILKPIVIVDIIDVINGIDDELYVINGVILFMGDSEYDPIIIADTTGILLVFGYLDAEIGDEVTIAGYRYYMEGLVTLYGSPDVHLIETTGFDMPHPMTATPMTVAEINLLDPMTVSGIPYVEVSGTVSMDMMFKEGVLLVDGTQHIVVFPPNTFIYDVLMSTVGLNVTFKGFLFPTQGDAPFDFYMVFVNYSGDIVAGTNSDPDIITAVSNYIDLLNQEDLYEGDHLMLSSMHPFLGVEIDWVPDAETALLVDMMSGEILALSEPTALNFTVTFTVGLVDTTIDITYMAYPTGYEIPLFEPGYLGTVMTLTDPMIEGQFPGLYVYKVESNLYFGDLIRSEAELRFPYAWELGFTHYTIELYNTLTEAWEPLYIEDVLAIAEYDNYSLYLPMDTLVRLRAHGDGIVDMVSNSVLVTLTNVSTEFLGWSLDESAWISDVMMPFVGRGLEVSMPDVYDLETFTYVTEGLGVSYQWYRVNPFTFEQVPIAGATDRIYITTIDDVGYHIMVRISGDEVNVGGYLQIFSFSETTIPVFGFVSNKTDTGFTLNLSHFVPIEDLDQLIIYDDFGEIDYTVIVPGDNAAIYHIEIDLTSSSYLWIELSALTWTLASQDEFHYGYMQGLYYDWSMMIE